MKTAALIVSLLAQAVISSSVGPCSTEEMRQNAVANALATLGCENYTCGKLNAYCTYCNLMQPIAISVAAKLLYYIIIQVVGSITLNVVKYTDNTSCISMHEVRRF